jgi:hypothetical protein
LPLAEFLAYQAEDREARTRPAVPGYRHRGPRCPRIRGLCQAGGYLDEAEAGQRQPGLSAGRSAALNQAVSVRGLRRWLVFRYANGQLDVLAYRRDRHMTLGGSPRRS